MEVNKDSEIKSLCINIPFEDLEIKSSTMSTDSKYQVSYQRPSQHIFYNFKAATLSSTFDIPFSCQFPVKEVRISCGFTGYSEVLTTIYATMHGLFPSGDVIQVFTGSITTDAGPDYVYTGSMNSGYVSYLFREPQVINGTYTMRLVDGGLGVGARFQMLGILHFELLG